MLLGVRTGESLAEGAAEGTADFLPLGLQDRPLALSCARFVLRNDISDRSDIWLWRGDLLIVSDGCSSCALADSRDGSPVAGTATLTFRDGPSCIQALSFRNV